MKYSQYQFGAMDQDRKEIYTRDFIQTIATNKNYKRLSGGGPMKFKRYRSAFTTEQVLFLEEQFKTCPYISNIQRKEVAKMLKLQEKAVKVWFQNRRMKEKHASINQASSDDTKNINRMNHNDQSYVDRTIHSTSQSREPCHSPNMQIQMESINNDYCVTTCQNSPTTTIEETPRISTLVKCEQLSPQRHSERSINNHPSATFASDNQNHGSILYESSAEFATDFGKKYTNSRRNESTTCHDEKQQDKNTASSPKQTTKQHSYSPESISYVSSTTTPHGLPTLLTSSRHNQATSVTANNINYSPHNLKHHHYMQPPSSIGNVIWRPLNIVPLGGSAASPAPIPNHAPLYIRPQHTQPKKKCNCDCHLPSSDTFVPQGTEPQYILTAIPYPHPILNNPTHRNINVMF